MHDLSNLNKIFDKINPSRTYPDGQPAMAPGPKPPKEETKNEEELPKRNLPDNSAGY
jgi:hypothetical protein